MCLQYSLTHSRCKNIVIIISPSHQRDEKEISTYQIMNIKLRVFGQVMFWLWMFAM